MATALRASGISVVGAMPWGTHMCLFYETTQDLLDTLVPYFKAGLEPRVLPVDPRCAPDGGGRQRGVAASGA